MNAPALITPAAEPRKPDIGLASIQINDASRYLAMASSRDLQTPGFQGWEYREAMRRLGEALGSLGYDMVKREAPEPAQAPALASVESAQ